MSNLAELFIKLTAIDAASRPIAALQKQLEGMNRAVRSTAGMREAGGHMMAFGAGIAGAGAAVGYGLIKTMEAASAVQEQVNRLGNVVPAGAAGLQELAMAQKAAAAYSMQHAISQEQALKQLYLGKSAGFDMATAIQSMNTAASLAIGLGGDMEATQRTLNLAYLNFKDPAKSAQENFQMLGDIMAKTTSAFDYKDVEEFRSQLELATPTALAAGMGTTEGMKDLAATLADFTRHGLTGSLAGAAFEESLHGVLKMSQNLGIALVHNKEGGLDYMHSLEQIRKHFIGLYGSMQAIPTGVLQEIQKTFGLRGLRALLLDPAEMEDMRAQLDHVNGAAAEFQKRMESSPAQQWAIFTNKLQALEIVIGTALFPAAMKFLGALGSIVTAIVNFTSAHPALTKFIVLFTALGAALALVVGGAAMFAGAILVVASMVAPIAGTVAAVLGIGVAIAAVVAAVAAVGGSFSSAFSSAWSAVTGFFSRLGALAIDMAPAFGALAIAVFGPFGVLIDAVALAGYEIYEHWSAIWGAISAVGRVVLSAFAAPFAAAFRIVEALFGGFVSAVTAPIASIAAFIESHWKGVATALAVGAALLAAPVTATIAVVAFAAVEIIRHWDSIKAGFSAVGSWLMANVGYMLTSPLSAAIALVCRLIPELYDAGANLIKQLAAGIASVAMMPVHAVETIASKIRSYLPFSPAKEGPLRELGHVKIVETIAQTIKPAPVASAMQKVAAAAAMALAVPLMMAVPAAAALPSFGPVSMLTQPIPTPRAAAAAAETARSTRGAGPVTINYAPVINLPPGADSADLLETLRKHAKELRQILSIEDIRRERADF